MHEFVHSNYLLLSGEGVRAGGEAVVKADGVLVAGRRTEKEYLPL